MVIDFPCQSTDLSLWFGQKKTDESSTDFISMAESFVAAATDEVMETLKEFLLDSGESTPSTPETNKNWLHQTNNEVAKCQPLMAPVMKDTPTSAWLANSQGPEKVQKQEANMSTSLWLASPTFSASSKLTCQTIDAAKEEKIEWPSILFAKSHQVWLQRKQQQQQSSETTELGDWLSISRTLQCQDVTLDRDESESVFSAWFESAGSAAEFSSWAANEKCQNEESKVEKWLRMAAEEDKDEEETLMDEDGSSIAIISDDFDVIGEDDDEDALLQSWLS